MKNFFIKIISWGIIGIIFIAILGWNTFWFVVGAGFILWIIHDLIMDAVAKGTYTALQELESWKEDRNDINDINDYDPELSMIRYEAKAYKEQEKKEQKSMAEKKPESKIKKEETLDDIMKRLEKETKNKNGG